jgi:hypothetical protein
MGGGNGVAAHCIRTAEGLCAAHRHGAAAQSEQSAQNRRRGGVLGRGRAGTASEAAHVMKTSSDLALLTGGLTGAPSSPFTPAFFGIGLVPLRHHL